MTTIAVLGFTFLGFGAGFLAGHVSHQRPARKPASDLDPALADDFAAGLRDVDILLAAAQAEREQEATRL